LKETKSKQLSSLPEQLIAFISELRNEGVAVGSSELIDAFATLSSIDWSSRSQFSTALSSAVAKSKTDQEIFNQVFEQFIFRSTEAESLSHDQLLGKLAHLDQDKAESIDHESLREQIYAAALAEDQSAMRDLAALTVAAFSSEGDRSGIVGVDLQRVRREFTSNQRLRELAAEGISELPSREQLAVFEQLVRKQLQRESIKRTGKLPPKAPISEYGRRLPSNTTDDLAAVYNTIAELKRQLATIKLHSSGGTSHLQVDLRRTLRRSLQTGGVPVDLKYRPRKPRRPELFVLCDISTSVSSAATFFLSVLHALNSSFHRLRSFVFVERVDEVTQLLKSERRIDRLGKRVSEDAGVIDSTGYTDYGRVWQEFYDDVIDDLYRRSTVLILGDARTNGRDPGTETFTKITKQAGRTVWLNPEPKLYWNYGDSVIGQYQQYCEVHECWQVKHLQQLVRSLATPSNRAVRKIV